jgi:hypothetical protein
MQRTHPILSISPKTHVLRRFGYFRYYMKIDAILAEQVLLTHKFAKQSRVGIFRNERTQSTPFDPKLIFWGVSDRFVTTRKSMQNWPNRCHYRTSSLKKVTSEFFATNAPDPLHWTQKSCFGVVWTVSLLHESRCKTGPAWSHYRTSSLNKVESKFFATNAPDPLHWIQNSCFGSFRTISLLHESPRKNGQPGAIIAQVR